MRAWLLRAVANGVAFALLLFALVAYRTTERGALELGESDRAFDAGQLERAVEHARRAAAAYVPAAAHVPLGFERLRAIARGAERARDIELSRLAWRSVRAAAIESRHLWQPQADELARADRELARLAGALPPSQVAAAGLTPAARLAGLLGGGLLALAGLVWACGREAVEGRGEPRARGRLALVSCLIGVAVWSAALLGA